MRLPNPQSAVVDTRKLSGYCLNPAHPHGAYKGRVFESVLGLTDEAEEELRQSLLAAARDEQAVRVGADRYGELFALDFRMRRADRTAMIRSIWIVRRGEDFPRLVTCYVR